MTTRSSRPLICACGHKGSLEFSENDQPYSGLWEDYSLAGFSGGSLTITSYRDKPKDMLTALSPTCPQCGQAGKVRYA